MFVCLFLMGCPSAFQPIPYVYEQWKKKGVSVEETKLILGKCGFQNFLGEGQNVTANEIALMHLCMEAHGFKYSGRFGTYCHQYPNLPACVEARSEKARSDK